MTSLTSLILSESDYRQLFEPKLINDSNFKYLSNLLSLKVYFKPSDVQFLTSIISQKNLSHLRNLTYFNNCHDTDACPEELFTRYGRDYSVLDNFKHLKVAKLHYYRNSSLVNCKRVQENYPSVRFIWGTFIEQERKNNLYEGEFDEANLYHGKGVLTYYDSEKYEGEFQSGNRHGKGTMTYLNGDRYEGEWKHDNRHGYGI